jgi:hypothetical protein
MSTAGKTGQPAIGSVVSTACGGLLRLDANTPQSIFHDRRIYFCLPSCKESFDQDPKTSCLVCNPLFEEEV